MSNTLLSEQPYVNCGLVTATYTVPSSGIYYVDFVMTEIPLSSLVITIKNNGSTVFTAPTIGQTQQMLKFRYSQLYAAADAITVVYSGNAGNDNLLNSIKANISIGVGQ